MNTIFIMTLVGFLSIFLFNMTDNTNTFLKHVSTQEKHDDKKTYVLLLEQNKIGNIDNSTKIISAIMGSNLTKIEEEFLEEISMIQSLQLKELVSQLINNGTMGLPCEASLHTEDGRNVSIDCFGSGNNIIWHIIPN